MPESPAPIGDEVLRAYQKWERGGRVTDLSTGLDLMDAEALQDLCELMRQDLKAVAADLLTLRRAARRAEKKLADVASFFVGRANRDDDLGWDDWMDEADAAREEAQALASLLPAETA